MSRDDDIGQLGVQRHDRVRLAEVATEIGIDAGIRGPFYEPPPRRRQGLLAVVGQVRRKRVVGRDMGIVRLGQRDRDAHARLALRALVQMDEDVLNPDL